MRAVNAAGAGPWSIESDQVICKYKSLKPKVSFKGFASKEAVNFKAGETMMFEADIEGKKITLIEEKYNFLQQILIFLKERLLFVSSGRNLPNFN